MQAMEAVPLSLIPKYSNVIGSHECYIRKISGRTKARICPWGNHDIEKDYLRADVPSLLIKVFRLVISIGAEHHWEIESMDVCAAFLQADGFTPTICI